MLTLHGFQLPQKFFKYIEKKMKKTMSKTCRLIFFQSSKNKMRGFYAANLYEKIIDSQLIK